MMPMPPRRAIFPVLFAVAFLAAAAWQVRLALTEDYWGDEGLSARRVETGWRQVLDPISKNPPVCTDPFDTGYVFDLNPPLYFVLARSIAGPHPGRLGLRLFSIVPMLATMALLVGWAYRRRGMLPATAVLAAFCLSPAMIYYGHEARPYALGMFITAVLTLALDRAWARPWALFAVNFGLAFAGILTHYHAAWVIATLAAMYAIRAWAEKETRRQSVAGCGGIALGVAAAMAAIAPVFYTLGVARNMPSRDIDPGAALRTLFLPLMSQNPHDRAQLALSLCAMLLFGAMAAYSIVKSRREACWLALWILPCLAPMAGRALLGQVFFERYSIFTTAAWMMLLAGMFRKELLGADLGRACAGLLGAAILANGAFWAGKHYDVPLRTPWRETIAAFQAAQKPGDYYAIEPNWLAACFAANAGRRPEARYLPTLAQIPADADRIWIFEAVGFQQPVAGMFARAGWRVSPAARDVGYWLWLVENPEKKGP
ncbi:MAG: hypothetical protein ABFD69_08390 [Candidatus Sumerlaeia bacterium]